MLRLTINYINVSAYYMELFLQLLTAAIQPSKENFRKNRSLN